jgi:tetratricopeptide (TPR) repeat protein
LSLLAILGAGVLMAAGPVQAGLKAAPNVNRAMELSDVGDFAGAIEIWDQWIDGHPGDAPAYAMRALAKLSLERWDEAIADYSRAIELKPEAAFVGYVQRSYAKYLKGDFDGAIADASRAIQQRPDFGRAYSYRGMARQAKEDLDGAIDDYSKAIAESWKQATAYRLLSKSEDENVAADAKRKVEETDLEEGRAYGLRSWARGLKGEFDAAIVDANHAIELNPKDGDAYGKRAAAKSGKGDMDGAIADLTKAVEILPKYSMGYAYRGYAKWRKNDNEGAIADYDRAIELDPQNAAYYRDRGRAKISQGNTDAAMADCNKAVELDPADYVARFHRGICRREKGDLDGSIADLSRVIEQDPGNGSAYRARADTHYFKKDWAAAVADFDAAARQGKPNRYGALMGCVVRMRQGEEERARKELAAYLANGGEKKDDWVGKLGEYLLGTLPEQDLILAAQSKDAATTRDQTCEAWYFVGMRHLAAGEKKEAADCFRKCLATEQKLFAEYLLSTMELKWLEEK